MFKIMRLSETPVEPMDGGRGEKLKLVNTSLPQAARDTVRCSQAS
jgi:hypothetical protein